MNFLRLHASASPKRTLSNGCKSSIVPPLLGSLSLSVPTTFQLSGRPVEPTMTGWNIAGNTSMFGAERNLHRLQGGDGSQPLKLLA